MTQIEFVSALQTHASVEMYCLNNKIIFGNEGNHVFAHRPDFINLQESNCGFGATLKDAVIDLLKQENKFK